ncbi:hypothetical protein [Telmatospirillum siberiense]|nr:hypothetical protein [Telmatospirillum siberiense]
MMRLNNSSLMSGAPTVFERFRLCSLAIGFAGASLLTACASDNSLLQGADARSAANKGNWASEVSNAEKASATNPTVVNQFNLATGYQNTGQNDKAIALYQDLVTKGQYTSVNPGRNDDGTPVAAADRNIADESARRIELIMGRPSDVVEYPEMDR